MNEVKEIDKEMISFIEETYMSNNRIFKCNTDEEIERFLKMYIDNLISIDWDGNIDFKILNNKFGIKYIELSKEFKHRGMNIQNIELERKRFHMKNSIIISQDKINNLNMQNNGKKVLFRFIKKKDLKYFQQGSIRFTRADIYKDERFNLAILDDEKTIKVKSEGLSLTFEHDPQKKIKPIDNQVKIQSQKDFYISCWSLDLKPIMFSAFEANCCIIVKNAEKLKSLIIESIKKKYPVCKYATGCIDYEFPNNLFHKKGLHQVKLDIFEYQKEYRFSVFLEDSSDEYFCVDIPIKEIDYDVIEVL